ncbi:LysR substrate-binding domain-containing protein [Devosia sp.]|uniref:LysR substrate-binding domain-containing protein n=1 Tax=Devosia sp. TaxID=1871048 RepID=UPI002AFF39E4|nr:LysR substrate-binding domain-containing protein [Devosia sp.]
MGGKTNGAEAGAESPQRYFFPSLTQLRAFSETARLGSISRASETLRRSQSAVTQAVQNLEAELDVALFSRKRTGSYLTEMGEILHQRAEACFSRMDDAVQEALGEDSVLPSGAAAIARRITKSQILALIAVNDYTSFAQAARHAGVSITSLHRSARSLEQHIGRRLFRNTAQGATTNEAGTRLAANLQLAVKELEAAEQEIRFHKGMLQGRLLLGALMLAGSHFIANELSVFVPLYPRIKVSLFSGSYDVMLGKLRSGSIDFLVGLLKNPPPVDDVVEEILGYDPYVIAVGHQHPLAGQQNVTLDDLVTSEWIMSHGDAHRRTIVNRLLDGAPAHYSIETHSLPTIFAFLASGNRMAILTRSELMLEERLGNPLVALNYVIDEPAAPIGVTLRKGWIPTRLQQEFLQFLRQQASERLSQHKKRRQGRSR